MSRALLAAGLLLVMAGAHAAPGRGVAALPSPASPAGNRTTAAPAWEHLSAEQRRERRAQHATWRAMTESERQRVRDAAARFVTLPPDRQQALRDQFNAQDQAFRDGWRLGPLLGEYFGRLQGMFGFVPEAQRDRTLAVLRQLSPAQLSQLALVAQRTPPQQREQVRTEFLGVAPGQRDAWLARQAGQ